MYFIRDVKTKFVRNHSHKERLSIFFEKLCHIFLASKKLRKWNFILTTLQMKYVYFKNEFLWLSNVHKFWNRSRKEKYVEMSLLMQFPFQDYYLIDTCFLLELGFTKSYGHLQVDHWILWPFSLISFLVDRSNALELSAIK